MFTALTHKRVVCMVPIRSAAMSFSSAEGCGMATPAPHHLKLSSHAMYGQPQVHPSTGTANAIGGPTLYWTVLHCTAKRLLPAGIALTPTALPGSQ